MKKAIDLARLLALSLMLAGTTLVLPAAAAAGAAQSPQRPAGPCDVYAAAGTPCTAAHSSTRALYSAYDGPLYQVLRQSDGKTADIGVVRPSASDAGGYADATAQDAFCAHTTCWISILYDQSDKKNHLIQPPRGGFSGPSLGGFNNLPLADMAPVTVMGHKAYGVFIAPGMGLRLNDAKGTAVDDQAQGQYWVINGKHYNAGCCFDYGNAEIDSRDDGNGTMETTYFGNAPYWYHGNPPGPWIMTDQENNLVGCVNEDKSKLCSKLENIAWRFVTAIAKGKPHHWATLGGDSRQGPLSVIYDGPRIDATYDPMRKQGAILLGNGGDNSNGSQGTFYEGAMTAAGTYPSHDTDQAVQANIVAAKYDVPRLSVTPASATATSPGLQTFAPGSSQAATVTFANTTGAPVSGLTLNLVLPKGWKAVAAGSKQSAKVFADAIAPGASVSANFTVTSGPAAFNGDLVAQAAWTANGEQKTEFAAEKVRNVSPVKINEFRISDGSANTTNAFIELYNAGAKAVDISHWSLTQHPTEEAIFSSVTVPAKTKLAPHGFYLLGLSNSGLAVSAQAGDAVVNVRSIDGMKEGDAVAIDTGAAVETRKIARLGTAAGRPTTLWQPLPEGPVITIPAGSTNVPVADIAGFTVGEKMAIGYGATYPAVGRDVEKYEVVTVTAVGKPGTQAFLAADAPAGATNIKVTSVASISPGDRIRLDIDSVGHGIETVTVKSVGTAGSRTVLAANAAAGASDIKVRDARGFAVGDKLAVGMPSNRQLVTVTAIAAGGPGGTNVSVTPVLAASHIAEEDAVAPGTGLELAAPLKFAHADNLPFSARGTGIGFTPASAFAHSSNEPVLPLGTGIALDKPLTKSHAIDAVVQDGSVKTAGYREKKAPNQWFGGPVLAASAGAMVLRDGSGHVVDSLNYGNLVDPWASEGYHQAVSGPERCQVTAPGVIGGWPPINRIATDSSAGRFPDGFDTDTNCTDFVTQTATTLPAGSPQGANNIKVANVLGFSAGQRVIVDADENTETAIIAAIGTAGVTKLRTASEAGATAISVADARDFTNGQTVVIGSGTGAETATVVTANNGWTGARITVGSPLKFAHAVGAEVSGTGITLTAALAKAHAGGASVAADLPTPGAPNAYSRPHR